MRRLAIFLIALLGAALVPPKAPSSRDCCPMGSDMSCCPDEDASDAGCGFKCCAPDDDGTALTTFPKAALSAPGFSATLASSQPLAIPGFNLPVSLAPAPETPPPRG